MLEAQYQDVVRVEIDNLYTAFVNILGERETIRYAEASVSAFLAALQNLAAVEQGGCACGSVTAFSVLQTTRSQLDNKVITEADFLQVKGQLDASELGLMDARELLHDALQSLCVLLNIPVEQADSLEPRGTIHDRLPPPPPVYELIRMVLALRPQGQRVLDFPLFYGVCC